MPCLHELTVQVAARAAPVTVLGPGLRYALWTQGCPFSCPGCVAPQFLPFTGGETIPVRVLAADLLTHDGLEGVTISGGEPFAQSAGVTAFARFAKAQGLSVIVYTGFRLEKLRRKAQRDMAVAELLLAADVLIDGRYDHALNDSHGLRGSANQRVHFLTSRYRGRREYFEDAPRRVEELAASCGTMVVGVPSIDMWRSSVSL